MNPTNHEPADVIDTSKMHPEQRAALEMTEAARETGGGESGFAGGLFMGDWNTATLHPFPLQSSEDRERGGAFLARLEAFLQSEVDPDEIDRTGEIPDAVIEGLARLGAFGIKIAPEHGGLGLSQTNYCRAAVLLASYCGNLAALVSAHQSIGVPQPLILFGTEEQKKRFLPRVAGGEISAFALTENGVGSDPARMQTRAEPTPDGSAFILNGEKLWCTNGIKAGAIVVMAKTPPKVVNGREREQVTAFLLDMDTPGVEIVQRCHFMGLHALYNAVVRFHNVRIPRENILLAEGKGLRVALTTLNTGRLTLPAACTGMSKRCLAISRRWAAERVQWGAPIGQHAAIADKIARMAAVTFAMESMTLYTARLVDRDKHADVRLEAAMCKLWASERSWECVDATMQIRGGRGYETAQSLAARGEEPVPVERFFRDSRINTIFEGSSEIMRLFIAREALDPHLKIGGPMMNTQLPPSQRVQAFLKASTFYARWYGALHAPVGKESGWNDRLVPSMRWAHRATRRLARSLFHAMAMHGPALERQQVLLGRFVDIGTELFAMATTASRAQALAELRRGKGEEGELSPVALAEYFCRLARERIEGLFEQIKHNSDRHGYRIAQNVLKGEGAWLEAGIVRCETRRDIAPHTNGEPRPGVDGTPVA